MRHQTAIAIQTHGVPSIKAIHGERVPSRCPWTSSRRAEKVSLHVMYSTTLMSQASGQVAKWTPRECFSIPVLLVRTLQGERVAASCCTLFYPARARLKRRHSQKKNARATRVHGPFTASPPRDLGSRNWKWRSLNGSECLAQRTPRAASSSSGVSAVSITVSYTGTKKPLAGFWATCIW